MSGDDIVLAGLGNDTIDGGDGTDYAWFDEAGRGTRVMVQDLTRILLMLVFLVCTYLVWKAWRNKERRQA